MSAQGELLDDTEARAEEEAARADNAADEAARAAEEAGRAADDAAKADARIRRLEQQVSNRTAISCSRQHHHRLCPTQQQFGAMLPLEWRAQT